MEQQIRLTNLSDFTDRGSTNELDELGHLRHLVGQIHLEDLKRLAALQAKSTAMFPTRIANQDELSELQQLEERRRLDAAVQNFDNETDLDFSVYKVEQAELDDLREKVREKTLANQELRERRNVQVEEKQQYIPTTSDFREGLWITTLTIAVLVEWALYKLGEVKLHLASHPRTRGALMIVTAVAILLGMAYAISPEISQYFNLQQGPLLAEALEPEHDLDARAMPVISGSGTTSVLPTALGAYKISYEPVEPPSLMSELTRCAIGISVETDSAGQPLYCSRSYGALYTEHHRYINDESKAIDVVAVLFDSEASAERTMLELLRYARQSGQVGNFALDDITSSNYFYARSPSTWQRWVSLTWRRGTWIFLVSAETLEDLDVVVEEFPH